MLEENNYLHLYQIRLQQSEMAFTKLLLPHHPSVTLATSCLPFWLPCNDSHICSLGPKLKFFQGLGPIYLKELKNPRRKIIGEAYLLRLNKLCATGQSLSKLMTQPLRVVGSVT